MKRHVNNLSSIIKSIFPDYGEQNRCTCMHDGKQTCATMRVLSKGADLLTFMTQLRTPRVAAFHWPDVWF